MKCCYKTKIRPFNRRGGSCDSLLYLPNGTFDVWLSGKYIVPKSALVDFLVGDFAFEIVHKSTWHLNTILLFAEKE